jgi:uncharacterized protein (TIGR03437 family)
MKNTVVCCGFLLLSALASTAQTAETIPFLELMQAGNEVPAINDTSSGNVIVWVHVLRDASGNVVSGSVDFDISTRFSSAVTITGLHIHNGAAGVNGPIVIPTDVNGTDKSIAVDGAGRVRIQKQVQFPSSSPAIAVSTITDLLANPESYYVNIHTTVNGGGAMRGQLMRAESRVFSGLMQTANEIPPVPAKGSAVGNVMLLRGQNSAGNRLATAIFNVDYAGVDPGTIFTGLHIHNGVSTVNGPVIINTGLSGTNTVTVDSTGGGNINIPVFMSPLDASFATELATVDSLYTDPRNQYINIHTTVFSGGMMRDQMRNTEAVTFKVTMKPDNEVPPVTGLTATSPAAVTAYVARDATGAPVGGAVLYDVDYRGFPPSTTFTGLHIHRGAAGANGSIVIQSGVDANAGKVLSDTGGGNIYRLFNVSDSTGLTALNDLLVNPNAFYVNIHTTVNPGGSMREQLMPALGKPAITGAAANASTITTVAPGSVMAIYGTNLAPFLSDLSGFTGMSALATSVNGVSVTVGGAKAPLYAVSPGQINAQVPFETAAGTQPVVVTNSAGASASFNATVAAVAPSIFLVDSAGTGAIVKNADFSLITAQNRARAGDVIVIYSTGLGQTTPAATTGALLVPPSGGFNNTGTVTVTMGGINAPVVYSIGSPGYAGLYQTAVTVPSGLTGSSVPLVLRSGTTASNTVNVAVQ